MSDFRPLCPTPRRPPMNYHMNYKRLTRTNDKKIEIKKTKRQLIGLRRHPDDLQCATKLKNGGWGFILDDLLRSLRFDAMIPHWV